jgi:hypothetical protein
MFFPLVASLSGQDASIRGIMEMYAHTEKALDLLVVDDGAGSVDAAKKGLSACESALGALSQGMNPSEKSLAEIPLAEDRTINLTTIRTLLSIAIRLHAREKDVEAYRHVHHAKGILLAVLEKAEVVKRSGRPRFISEVARTTSVTNRVTLVITNISTVLLTNYVTAVDARTPGSRNGANAAEVQKITLTNVVTELRARESFDPNHPVRITNYVTRTNVHSITVTNEARDLRAVVPGAPGQAPWKSALPADAIVRTNYLTVHRTNWTILTNLIQAISPSRPAGGAGQEPGRSSQVWLTNWTLLVRTNRITLTNFVSTGERVAATAPRGTTETLFITNRVFMTNRVTVSNRVFITNRVMVSNRVFLTNRYYATNRITLIEGRVVSNQEKVVEGPRSESTLTSVGHVDAPPPGATPWLKFILGSLAFAAIAVAIALRFGGRKGKKTASLR